jgi:hypothetical protein
VTCSTRRGSVQLVTVAEQAHAADGAQGAPRLIRGVRPHEGARLTLVIHLRT